MGEESRSAPSILVPSSGEPSVLECMRTLRNYGINTVLTDEGRSLPEFSSRYFSESVEVPALQDDLVAHKNALLSVASRPDIYSIIPIGEEDVYILSRYQSEFEEVVSVSVPPFETLRNVHDRIRLFEAAKEADVPVPETKLYDQVDDWNEELIVKPRYPILTAAYDDSRSPSDCSYKSGTIYLSPDVEPNRDEIVAKMEHVPIVQEYVKGTEYAFRALYNNGEPLMTSQKRQIRGETYAGGASVFRETVSVPELEAVGRKLLDSLEWHGLASVEFLRDDETGEFKLMEVNPRIWASLSCSVRAGAEYPYYYWLLTTSKSDRIDGEYRTGVGTHDLSGEVNYLLSVFRDENPLVDRPRKLTAAGEIVSSCIRQPHFDYFYLDDPFPLVQKAMNVF